MTKTNCYNGLIREKSYLYAYKFLSTRIWICHYGDQSTEQRRDVYFADNTGLLRIIMKLLFFFNIKFQTLRNEIIINVLIVKNPSYNYACFVDGI